MKDGDLAWSGTHAACVLRGIMYKASRAHMGDLRTEGGYGELGGHSAVNNNLRGKISGEHVCTALAKSFIFATFACRGGGRMGRYSRIATTLFNYRFDRVLLCSTTEPFQEPNMLAGPF